MALMIAIGIVCGIGIVFLIPGILMRSSENWDIRELGENFRIAGVIILVIAMTTGGGVLVFQYNESRLLPEKIVGLNDTIVQQKEMLSEISSQDVQLGLEGIEIKKTIQETIKEYNLALARARYLQKNAWVFFKPRLSTEATY